MSRGHGPDRHLVVMHLCIQVVRFYSIATFQVRGCAVVDKHI